VTDDERLAERDVHRLGRELQRAQRQGHSDEERDAFCFDVSGGADGSPPKRPLATRVDLTIADHAEFAPLPSPLLAFARSHPKTSQGQKTDHIRLHLTKFLTLLTSWGHEAHRATVVFGRRKPVCIILETTGHDYAAARVGVCIRNNRDLVFFATPQSRKFQITEIASHTK